MELDARWALPVYPLLKAQSHWKMCEHILKKQRPNTIQILWIVKKPVEYQYSSSSRKKPVESQSQYSSSSRKDTHV